MRLHEDKTLFKKIIGSTSKNSNMLPAQIEKDYYISAILSEAMERIPGLVFKGGTSLSKCYKVINRFSEDIDLTLSEEYFTRSNKVSALHELVSICHDLGLKLNNEEKILNYSHGKYFKFKLEYPAIFVSSTESPNIILEMVYIQKTFPYVMGTMNSYIGEYLQSDNNNLDLKKYKMEDFPVRLQSLERTLIDKVFAICDYYLSEKYTRNSRHIYDIYKLLDRIDLSDPQIKELVRKVRELRKNNDKSYSAQDGIDVPYILKEIIWNHSFENDYYERTKKLLYEHIEYEEAINGIYDIIDSKIFELPQSEKERIKS